MTSKPIRLLALVLTALLALTACTGGTTTNTDTDTGSDTATDRDTDTDTATDTDTDEAVASNGGSETKADSGVDRDDGDDSSGPSVAVADLDPNVATMIANLGLGYEQVDGVWNGFVPNDHPAVIVRKDGANTVVGAVAFNHPEPAALGTVTPVDTTGLPFRSIHLVTEPTDVAAMDALDGFDFHAQLGGVDSFAMVALPGDDFFDPTAKDYVSTLLHEMFHRYQDEAFQQMVGQDVEGYAYTAENLELAVLEERALREAIVATTDEARDEAAARFAAIRQTRLAADPRVVLDDSQETVEGSARYIEHRLGDDPASGYLMDATNYDADLVTSFDLRSGVKDTFGFGRWYASGAAIFRLLDLMEVDDVAARVEAGASPAEILAAELGVTESDRDDLVTKAKINYDPRGELAAQAAKAAKTAASEPAVFDDQPLPDGEGGETGGESTGDKALTDEEIACLTEQGVDSEAEGAAITDEQFDACLA